ncbi:unnamed protein product [Amoebophrya sp. A25]|nr:unnamed protein product [Amoebophrya sp. A25]|eukprot:GSA25T00020744001.1
MCLSNSGSCSSFTSPLSCAGTSAHDVAGSGGSDCPNSKSSHRGAPATGKRLQLRDFSFWWCGWWTSSLDKGE